MGPKPGQVVFGILLIVLLLAMAGFFAWRQVRALRGLRQAGDEPLQDRLYTRNLAYRRLLCSFLMVVLAALIGGLFYLENPMNALIAQGAANVEAGKPRPPTPQEQALVDNYSMYVGIMMIVLFIIIVLAAVDYFAIRRYAQRHYQKIQSDRRTMIENQLAKLRSQRNGHH